MPTAQDVARHDALADLLGDMTPDTTIGEINETNAEVDYEQLGIAGLKRYVVVEMNHHMGSREMAATMYDDPRDVEKYLRYLLVEQEAPDWQPHAVLDLDRGCEVEWTTVVSLEIEPARHLK